MARELLPLLKEAEEILRHVDNKELADDIISRVEKILHMAGIKFSL